MPAAAQTYPARPIRVIVTTSPGGISDVFVRALSEPLHKRLGQPVVVENRAGGFMILGARACAEAAPDGYTLCVMPSEPLTYNLFTQKSLPYDPVKSFDPVTNFFFITQALGVSAKLGVKTVDELAAYSKPKAGTLSYSAPSTSLVYFMENWKKKTGADLVRVPFKGGGDTVTNMLSGVTPVGFLGLGNFLSYIRAGQVTPLLVDSASASPPSRRRRRWARWASRATTPAPSSGCWRRPVRRRRSPSGSARRSSRSPPIRPSCSAISSTAASSRSSIRPRSSANSSWATACGRSTSSRNPGWRQQWPLVTTPSAGSPSATPDRRP